MFLRALQKVASSLQAPSKHSMEMMQSSGGGDMGPMGLALVTSHFRTCFTFFLSFSCFLAHFSLARKCKNK